MARLEALSTRQAKGVVVGLQGLAAAISMVGTVLVLRKAGLEARGVLAAVLTIAVLVPAFSVFSLDFAIPWYVRCYGRTPELQRVVRQASVLSAGISATLALGLLSLLPLGLGWAIVGCTSLGVGLAAPTLLRAGVLRAMGHIWIDPVQGVIRASISTSAALLTDDISVLTFSIALSLASAWAVGEVCGRVLGSGLPTGDVRGGVPLAGRDIIRYGGRLHFGTMAVLLSYRVDQLLILGVGSVAALGIYSTAVAVSEAVLLPVTALLPVLFVEESRAALSKGVRLGRMSKACLWFGALAGIVMYLARNAVATVLVGSDQAHELAICIAWLGPAAAAVCAWRVVSLVSAARGRPEHRSIAAIPAIAVTIVGNLLFVGQYGSTGAAVVSLVAYSAGLGAMLWLLLAVREDLE